jgi:hypothetical protein
MRRPTQPVAGLGLRRVRCIVLHQRGEETTAEVLGIGHRYPRRVRVPLTTAARLAADGVPVVRAGAGAR